MCYNYTVIIGGQSAGKTSIMEKLINNKFNTIVDPTFGPDLYRYSVNGNKMEILEIGGQDKCTHIVEAYCKLANQFIVVYDITSYKSFIIANYWINYLRQEFANDNEITIVLVANKYDLEYKREVNADLGHKLALNYNSKFIETSALLGYNLNDIFKVMRNS